MAGERFSFRWGIPWLDSGYTTIPNFMIRHYAEAGVTRVEFLVIIHLAAYHYESAGGQASPSLETVAEEMGYRDSEAVRYHIRNLEAKGMLTRHLRTGDTSVYDLSGFSCEVLAAHLEGEEADTLQNSLETPQNGFGDRLQIALEQRTRKEQHQEKDDDGVSSELAQKLIALGVHESMAWKLAALRAPEMMLGWIAYVQRNGQSIHDVPAFLVAKLRDGEDPPVRERTERDEERYIDGPYADLIQH